MTGHDLAGLAVLILVVGAAMTVGAVIGVLGTMAGAAAARRRRRREGEP